MRLDRSTVRRVEPWLVAAVVVAGGGVAASYLVWPYLLTSAAFAAAVVVAGSLVFVLRGLGVGRAFVELVAPLTLMPVAVPLALLSAYDLIAAIAVALAAVLIVVVVWQVSRSDMPGGAQTAGAWMGAQRHPRRPPAILAALVVVLVGSMLASGNYVFAAIVAVASIAAAVAQTRGLFDRGSTTSLDAQSEIAWLRSHPGAVTAVIGPLLLSTFAFWLIDQPHAYSAAGAIMFVALLLWAVAAVLRALGMRQQGGAAAVFARVALLAFGVCVFWVAIPPSPATVVAGLILGGAAWIAIGRRSVASARALSLPPALLAGLLVFVAVAVAQGTTGRPATLGARAVAGEAAGQSVAPSTRTEQQLIEDYAPVLATHEQEDWLPVPVDYFLEHALVSTCKNDTVIDGKPWSGPSDQTTILALSTSPAHCTELTIDHCYKGDLPCSGKTRYADGERGGLTSRRAVYARVIRATGGARAKALLKEPMSDVLLVKDADGRPRALHALVQYWIFYRYNEWLAPLLGGELTQRHEGDWEAITVGLYPQRPAFVAFSAHCGGSWLPWNEVQREALDAKRAPNGKLDHYERSTVKAATHPVAAVALGSHANYPGAEDKRPPDWASCEDVSMPVGDLSWALNMRDVTDDYARFAMIPVLVTERSKEMSFPGGWGGFDSVEFTLTSGRHPFDREDGSHGPPSPPLQPLWTNPLRSIFCGDAWRGPEKRPAACDD